MRKPSKANETDSYINLLLFHFAHWWVEDKLAAKCARSTTQFGWILYHSDGDSYKQPMCLFCFVFFFLSSYFCLHSFHMSMRFVFHLQLHVCSDFIFIRFVGLCAAAAVVAKVSKWRNDTSKMQTIFHYAHSVVSIHEMPIESVKCSRCETISIDHCILCIRKATTTNNNIDKMFSKRQW